MQQKKHLCPSWSKGFDSSSNIFVCVGSNPTGCNLTFALILIHYHHLFGLNYFGRIHTAALLDNQLLLFEIKHKINKHTHNGRRRKTTTNGNTTDSIHMQYNRIHTMTTKRLLRLLASIRVLCVPGSLAN